ncbi:zinc finger domain-containing protein [Streptomyces shenzhenensis]
MEFAHLTVACPICRTRVGEPCDIRHGRRTYHLARADKAFHARDGD